MNIFKLPHGSKISTNVDIRVLPVFNLQWFSVQFHPNLPTCWQIRVFRKLASTRQTKQNKGSPNCNIWTLYILFKFYFVHQIVLFGSNNQNSTICWTFVLFGHLCKRAIQITSEFNQGIFRWFQIILKFWSLSWITSSSHKKSTS